MEAKEKFMKYSFNGWNVNRHTEHLTDLYVVWCFHQTDIECLHHKWSFMDAETLLKKGSTRNGMPLTKKQIKFLKGFIELFYQAQEWKSSQEDDDDDLDEEEAN